MSQTKDRVHPYIPNSVPAIRTQMMKAINVGDVEELYNSIPYELRLSRRLNLPEPLVSEYALKRHMEQILAKNKSCQENLSFLGAGCWQPYVPAVCDEVNSRAEFLTAYAGDTYSDLGRLQAIFEYQSMLGELVGMEVVSAPTYDWAAAASSSILMAARITGRTLVLVPRTLSREKWLQMRNVCKPVVRLEMVDYDPATGLMDLADLEGKISEETAAVYWENPGYLGMIETQSEEIARIAHRHGALCVAGVDPSSLGVLAPPSAYGADIVCGDAQPLGNHMHGGGGLCGFIATPDEEKYVAEYPTLLISIAPGQKPGEFGFGQCTHDRTSYVTRETSPDYIGTTQWLWGITAGVYMALMGPRGMRELGRTIMQNSHYAMQRLAAVRGVRAPLFQATHFKEFVVNFDATGKSVAAINRELRRRGIFGGKDLSNEFPELGNSALYCVTEIHMKEDLDRLAQALEEVLQ